MILNQLEYINKSVHTERNERKISLKKGQIYFLKPLLYQMGFKNIYMPRYVNSIYFDDESLSLARQNIDGVRSRIKVRLRFYDNSYDNAKLEMKFKNGQLGRKYAIPMSKEIKTKKDLITEADKVLKEISINELYATSHVKYHREYLIDNENIRCTLDTRIVTSRLKNEISFSLSDSFYDVCEFKYDPYLDKTFRVKYNELKKFSGRATKSSKYLKSIIYG